MIQIANQEIKNVSQWLDSKELILNVSKTNFMMFKTRRKTLTCQLESQLAKSIKKNHVVYHRTNYGKLKAKGTKRWNDLPDDVKKSNSYAKEK